MQQQGYLLGYDIGSSSVKASLIETDTGRCAASAVSPESEMEIISSRPGWAEQHPDQWWEHVKRATAALRSESGIDLRDVKAIGIAYQMHGLVMVDDLMRALAPSIIWCDSRAVEIGRRALLAIGRKKCLSQLLNSPGNFTASKLKWVKDNEPDLYRRIFKIMLPGDYIAMKLTDRIVTTPQGLSEGILWDYRHQRPADFILKHYGISPDVLPEIVPCFAVQGEVTKASADELGLHPGIPVSYRAGDQPNNALSLNVLNPGEVAATAGTSGVVYGVIDSAAHDPACRVNTFLHVNNTPRARRHGVLLCVNGTGILNRWLRTVLGGWSQQGLSYAQMDAEAQQAPPGCDGLYVLPYGNGAERTLGNKNIHASVHGIDLTRHTRAHLLRAAQEGIIFALRYGLDIMREMGLNIKVVRAGHANMFKSELFADVFAAVSQARLELYNTDGSQGAARGAGIGAGIYKNSAEAFASLRVVKTIALDSRLKQVYEEHYAQWKRILRKHGIIH
jgi:xylulokinase